MRMDYWDFEEDIDDVTRIGLQVIGAMIREARLRRGLTQRQLAWRSGFSQATISRLETGKLRGMRLHTLAAIIGVLQADRSRADRSRADRSRADPSGAPPTQPPGSTLDDEDDVEDVGEPPPARRRLPGQAALESADV